jgi:AraC-like DNA-binding protein
MLRTDKPAAALQPFVRFYAHVTDHFPAQAFIRPVPARTAIALDFMLGDLYDAEISTGGQSWHETTHPIALIGVQAYRRVQLALRGRVDEFVVVFQPSGLSGLFRVPPDELTNRHFEGRAVLGRSVDELRCRLGEARSFAERVHVADEFLLARVPHGSPSGVTVAARELHRHRGCVRISSLADMAGLGLRQFERRFTSEVGMAPKLYARIARFEAAIEIKMRAPALRWTDVAHALGYHDQAHMVRDFQQLAGSTPSDLVPHLEMIVPPEIEGSG